MTRRIQSRYWVSAVCMVGLLWPGVCWTADISEQWEAFSDRFDSQFREIDDPVRQAGLIREFATEDYAEAAAYLVELIDERRTYPLVKLAAADVLGGYQSKGARSVVASAVESGLKQNSYLLQAYIAHGNQQAIKFLLNLAAKAETPRTQTLAIDGLQHLARPEELPVGYWEALIKWSEDPEVFYGVRLAAVRALGSWDDYHAVAALMRHLDDPNFREAARDGLTRLTGERFWDWNYGWREWWKGKEGNYAPEPLSEDAYDLAVCELTEKARMEKEEDDLDFFGIKVSGENILLILDCSGSMYYEDRLVRMQKELSAMVEQLEERIQFGLLLFPETSIPGRDFGEASSRYKERIQEFILEMFPDGQTPMGEAIFHAYNRIVPREEVDTIYLLSDGMPSDTTPSFLLNEIVGYYEEYQVTVNTVFIGDDEIGRKLMRDVASHTKGQFIHVP